MTSDAPPPPAELFAVRNLRGGPWDWARGMREQAGWKDHAAFMNGLVDEGVIVIGGPLEGDREALLIFRAASAQEVRRRLAEDPWAANGMLTVKSIERWTILLSPPAVDEILAAPRPGATASASAEPPAERER